jgi:hypothetical protein
METTQACSMMRHGGMTHVQANKKREEAIFDSKYWIDQRANTFQGRVRIVSLMAVRIYGENIQGRIQSKEMRSAVMTWFKKKKVRANTAQFNRSANHALTQEKIKGKGIDPSSNQRYSDNSEKNILTTLSSTSSTTTSTAACYARGLVIMHSHKLSSTLGGSTSTRPGVRNITLRPTISSTCKQHGDPNNARGLDNNFASDCDSTTTTRLRHCRLRPRRLRRTR